MAFHIPLRYIESTSRTRLYIGRPLVNGCALDSTTTDLSSHVSCVYRETLLGFLIQLRKTLWPSSLEKYIKKSTRGDYYARTLSISGDPTRIPCPSEKNHLAILFGEIHRKQHSRRLLCMYPCGISRVAPA